MKISIKLSHSEIKNQALAQAGIPGEVFGHRKGGQRHKCKRAALRRGEAKHKGRSFE